MWLLPTRGRAKQAQSVIDCCMDMKMTSSCLLFVDGDVDGEYDNVRVPKNWIKLVHPRRVGIGYPMQYVFTTYPGEYAYGWLADDTFPETVFFDKRIEEYTTGTHFVHTYDKYICDKPEWMHNVRRGNIMTSGLCWGGSLLRYIGWWAYPKVKQVAIDFIWTNLLQDTGVARYMPGVTVRHDNWNTGRRSKDDVDNHVYNVDYNTDLKIAQDFMASAEFKKLRSGMMERFGTS